MLIKLYYILASMDMLPKYLKVIDDKVKNVVNRFRKGQCLQKSFIYANSRNGGLGLPCMKINMQLIKITI
jgi:hypothetical protein